MAITVKDPPKIESLSAKTIGDVIAGKTESISPLSVYKASYGEDWPRVYQAALKNNPSLSKVLEKNVPITLTTDVKNAEFRVGDAYRGTPGGIRVNPDFYSRYKQGDSEAVSLMREILPHELTHFQHLDPLSQQTFTKSGVHGGTPYLTTKKSEPTSSSSRLTEYDAYAKGQLQKALENARQDGYSVGALPAESENPTARMGEILSQYNQSLQRKIAHGKKLGQNTKPLEYDLKRNTSILNQYQGAIKEFPKELELMSKKFVEAQTPKVSIVDGGYQIS
jgi:hypothetical protein